MGITGSDELRDLGRRLSDAGTEGQGLRKELRRQLADAARPLARDIADPARIRPYMPDRYADALAGDLKATINQVLSGSDARIAVEARGRLHKRKLVQREDGILWHPVYGQGLRKTWNWSKRPQTGGMRPGFFSDAVQAAAPRVREAARAAVAETFRKVAHG